jgi:hypothetical protein
VVLSRDGEAAANAASGPGSRPIHAKRVAFSASSSMPSASTVAPYSAAAWRDPIAACGGAPASVPPSATARTASAVEAAETTAAPGSCSPRKRAHWPVACGCECTVRTSSGAIGSAATRQ